MTQKKLQVWLPILFSITLITGMFFGYKLKDNMGLFGPSFTGKNKKTNLQEILELIRMKYVDTLNIDSLGLSAIETVLNQLDPHSVYIPASQVKQMNDELQGNFEGVGIEFELIDDTVTVFNLVPKGPAEIAGIQVGDQILQANDSVITGIKASPDKIRNIVRGPRGTTVLLKVIRGTDQKKIAVQRGVIPLKSVDAAYMIQPGTGYIRLNKFASNTYEEFMEQLERLKKEGMKHLILDLRDNGGGILDDAVQMADEFLNGSKEIVYTDGKSSPKQIYTARRPGLFEEGTLMILINEGTASASEVLTGALQDWDRATIVGRRSFGKGLVQEQFNLNDGSALRLTVSRYFTPIGRSIQKPYKKGEDSAYRNEVLNRFSNGQLFHRDTANHTGKPYTTKGGRVVYGGGGITPDVFVALDSLSLFFYKNESINQNLLSKAAFSYFQKNKAELSKLKEPAALKTYLDKDPGIWESFKQVVQKENIDIGFLTEPQKSFLLQQLEALIGRQLWRKEGYFQMLNFSDPMIQKAMELIKK